MGFLRREIFKVSAAAWVAALLPALLIANLVEAETAELVAAKDNTLYYSATGTLSNGSGAYFFSGRNADGNQRRAVLQFDLSSIPPGSTITGAELTLYMSRTSNGAQEMQLRQLLADWGEGASDASGNEGGGAAAQTDDATWVHTFYSSSSWAAAGGDYSSTTSASQTVDAVGYYTWSSSKMVVDVQYWLANPGANFGWLVLGNESNPSTTKRFNSRENSAAASRPLLTVLFTDALIFTDGFESGDTTMWSATVP